MQEFREEIVVQETVVEEFVVDGSVVAEVEQRTEIVLEEHEKAIVTVVLTTGPKHPFPFHPEELVGKLVREAVKYFGEQHQLDPTQPYELLRDGNKLDDGKTLEASGVKPCDELTLSPCKRPVDG